MNLPTEEQAKVENGYINKKIQESQELMENMNNYLIDHSDYVKEIAQDLGLFELEMDDLNNEIQKLDNKIDDLECQKEELYQENTQMAKTITNMEQQITAFEHENRMLLKDLEHEQGIKDHVFVPGDVSNGWECECSVHAPVKEAGQWVRACCGYPPEAHIQTTDPIHSVWCKERTEGDGKCNCWVTTYPLAFW